MTDWTEVARSFAATVERDGDRLAAELAAAYPAFAGQMQAAVADAAVRHELGAAAVKAAEPGAYSEVRSDETARAQLNGHFLRLISGLADGTVEHCPHVNLAAPRPAVAAAFGNRVDCYACYPSSPRPSLTEAEEHTCDLCRGYVPGQAIHAVLPRCGVLTIVAGVCDACLRRMGAPA